MAHLSEPSPEEPTPEVSRPGLGQRLRRAVRKITAFQPRTHWWNLIDYFEARPSVLRRLIVWTIALAVLGAGGSYGYVRWHRMNLIRVARQWLDAGRLDRAGPAVQAALAEQPLRPESWELGATLAWQRGQKLAALAYSEHAAQASRYAAPYVLGWAETAALANQPAEAARALAQLDPKVRAQSARAERVAGEIERQKGSFAEARDHFAAALKLDLAGPVLPADHRFAIDEVPLGLVELRTGDPADHRRALELLTHWAPDRQWGADAMRDLLADALNRHDRADAIRWAEALRAHPRCAVGDIPSCLLALATYDEARYRTMLATLEASFNQEPNRIAVLIGWLTQISRPADGLAWARTLPGNLTDHSPVSIAVAEALVKLRQWSELAAWTKRGPWGPDTEFLRSAFRLKAAHELHDEAGAAQALTSLKALVQGRGDWALFAGANLYAWGLQDPAVALLWIAADHPNVAIQALGTILRHYQLMHDAGGEYQAFRRLHSLRPHDPAIANNFVFFAVLTGQYDQAEVERLARENFQRDPNNILYRANYAFLLDSTGRLDQGLPLLEAKADTWHTAQGFAFAYGLALAQVGRRDKAREVLAVVDLNLLTQQERDLVRAAVR
jgi:hypothetical protein